MIPDDIKAFLERVGVCLLFAMQDDDHPVCGNVILVPVDQWREVLREQERLKTKYFPDAPVPEWEDKWYGRDGTIQDEMGR